MKSNYCVTFKYILKYWNVSNNFDPTSTSLQLNSKCACSCMEASNAWKHSTLKDVWITWHWLGEARAKCAFHNYTRFFSFLEGKVMAVLPFKEGYFWIIWACHSCFSLTHLCRCVSDDVCFRVCVNNTLPTLPLIGLPWNVTLLQPIIIIYAVSRAHLLRKNSKVRERERVIYLVWWKKRFNYCNMLNFQ